MANINQLVYESYETAHHVVRHLIRHGVPQAAIWGVGSFAAHHLTERKHRHKMTPEEIKESKRKGRIAFGTGAASGAIGSFL